MSFPLFDLPTELRAIVLSFLPGPHERAALARTCRLLNGEVEQNLYSDVVLRDFDASKALHRAFIAKPSRLLLVKHMTYLYIFGRDDDEYDGFCIHALTHDYHEASTKVIDTDCVGSLFNFTNMKFLINLRTFMVQLAEGLHGPTGQEYTAQDYEVTKAYCEKFLHRASQKPQHLVSVDLDFAGTRPDLCSLNGLARSFNIWTLETLRLSHFDACEVPTYAMLSSSKHELQLVRLILDHCEINAIYLVELLQKMKKLKSISLSSTDIIWGQWTDVPEIKLEMPADYSAKGRWFDILHSIEKASVQGRLEILECTALNEYCTIPTQDKPLDFAGFPKLRELTLDAHMSIKGLPDSLRVLTLVRSKAFRGACLPLLENRLREVRSCCLTNVVRDTQRKVIIKIPDRSRGYESLRVMAVTWKSIGFEPTIEVDE